MKRSLIALALVAALPFAASAQDANSGLSYNYVEAGYAQINSDLDADGWAVKGSVAVAPNFHLFGRYGALETERAFGITADADLWEIGAGFNTSISDKTDFVGTLAYQKAEVSARGLFSEDAEGYAAEAGVRSALSPMFEGYAMAGYEDAKNVDGDFYGRVGGLLKFNKNWGVSADVKLADGDTQWFVGPRLTW